MKTNERFEQWLAAATQGLTWSVRQRLNLELASHFQDALEAGITAGLSEEEASAKALQALGEPKAAREVFRQEYPLEMPWDQLDHFPEKPVEHPYGYLRGNQLVPCSKEQLIEQVWSRDWGVQGLDRVWIPETDRVVRVESVPFLLEAMKERAIKYAKKELWLSLPYAVVFGVVMAGVKLKPKWGGDFWARAIEPGMEMFMIVMLFCWLGQSYVAFQLLRGMRRRTPQTLSLERDADAFRDWACDKVCNSLKVSRFTPALFGMWLLVAFLQFVSWVIHGDYSVSINNTGLLRSAVFAGEWWRLATAIHISTDALAMIPTIGLLLFYGSLIEGFFKRGFVPIIFWGSATAGLLVGLCGKTPVSGMTAGALGLVGFLVVTARSDNRLQRLKSVTAFPVVIAFYGIAGVFFFSPLDTAVNVGGFLTGALLAHLFSTRIDVVGEQRWFRYAGILAGGFLLASGAAACALFIMNWFGFSFTL